MGTDPGPLFGTWETVPTSLTWVRARPRPRPGAAGWGGGVGWGGAAPNRGPVSVPTSPELFSPIRLALGVLTGY